MQKIFTPVANKRLPLLIAILIVLILNPYFMWWLSSATPLYRIALNFIIPVLFYLSKEHKDRRTPVVLYLLSTFLYVFVGLLLGRASIIGAVSASICFLYIFVFFANWRLLFDVLEQLINILFVIVGLSVVAWVIYLTGHLSPMGTIQSPMIADTTYTMYPLFVVSNNLFEYGSVIRFSGPFVEPGFLGTLVALILVAKKYNLKDVRLVVLFIAGLFTLSLAFYLISAFFGLFYLAVEKRKIVATVLLVSFTGIFYWQTKDNSILSQTLYERVEWNAETKSISGDNRSNDLVDAYYERIKGTSDFYFGTSDPNWYQNVAGGNSASYKNVICINGFLTVALYLLYLLQLGWVNRRSLAGFILFAAVFLMNFYQRSSFYSLPVLYLYCCMAKADNVLQPQMRRSTQI